MLLSKCLYIHKKIVREYGAKDSVMFFHQKWKFSRQLIEEYSILVFKRTSKNSSDSSLFKSLKSNIKKLRNPLYPHSSTEIRKRIEQGLDISSLVPEPVFNIIKNHILINHFST